MRTWSTMIMAGLLAGGCLLLSLPAQAQINDNRIQQREQNEQQRIQQGIQSGSITPGEAQRLEAEQNRIQRTEDRMKADGKLSPRERDRLNNELNKAGRDIHKESHDSQVVGSGPGNKERERCAERERHRRANYREEHNRWRNQDNH